jgi:uncharacterized protein (DUF3820 family)
MKQAIGFANKFFTLWSIETEGIFTTDSFGKQWLTGYSTKFTYHKNISVDLEKVKTLYPGIEVSEDLRGKTQSWVSKNEEQEDLCPQIMKFGKYYGFDINDLVEKDLQYIIWICENKGYTSNGKYANNLPKVKEYFKSIEDAENKIISDRNTAFQEILKKGFYEFIPQKNLSIHENMAYISVKEGDFYIQFIFEYGSFSEQHYNGFTYGLPLVKGKAKRIKGKTIRFEIVEDNSNPFQVIVKNVIV